MKIHPQENMALEPRYAELGYLEHLATSNRSLLPWTQVNPGYLKLKYYCLKEHWLKSSGSVKALPEGDLSESWEMCWW